MIYSLSNTGGVGAAGSASDWQSGGHEFEPRTLHHNRSKCLTALLFYSFEQRYFSDKTLHLIYVNATLLAIPVMPVLQTSTIS